jgi:hypothetical protein
VVTDHHHVLDSTHTLTNTYADSWDYYQFAQRGGQNLLDSGALHSERTLREVLVADVIAGCEASDEREVRLLHAVLEKGDISKLLIYAERIFMLKNKGIFTHVCETAFGEWEFASLVIVPPTFREQQDNLWAEDPDLPKEDWKNEVRDDATHQGYWEWVEDRRE